MKVELNQVSLPKESLPFVIKQVETLDEMKKLLELRMLCYGHHMPDIKDTFKMPQECDFYDSTINIIAVDKRDGHLLGAIRTEINVNHKLSIQDDLDIPEEFLRGRLATATKLCIIPSEISHLVKVALFKSFYISLTTHNVDHVIIAARKQLEVFYQRNLCDIDLYSDDPYRKLSSVAGIEHRIYGMRVDQLAERWISTPHPKIEFLVSRCHPDIMV